MHRLLLRSAGALGTALLLSHCGGMAPSGGRGDETAELANEDSGALENATPSNKAEACASASTGGAPTQAFAPAAAETPTYEKDVKPLVDAKCAWCHSASAQPGDRQAPYLTTYDQVRAKASEALEEMRGGEMPPVGVTPALASGDADLLARWLAAGAPRGTPPPPIDATQPATYAGTIQAILVGNCVGCHKSGATPPALDGYDAAKSAAAASLAAMDAGRMPKAGKLPAATIAALKAWIDAGMPYDAAGSTPPPASATSAGCAPALLLSHPAAAQQEQ